MMNIIRGGKKWRHVLDLEHSQIYEPDNAWVALTDGKYKYIYFTLTGEEQLFNLQNDPYELNNILDDQSGSRIHKKWYKMMVEHLNIRGSDWVLDKKLAVQKKSILQGEHFPVN